MIVDHCLTTARQVPSPNCNERPPFQEIEVLVIHAISLPPGRYGGGHIEAFFTNTLDVSLDVYFTEIADLHVSAHLLIDRHGAVTQFVPFDRRAWHAGKSCFKGRENCNDFSIGIELEGCDEEAFTSAQYDTLVDVVAQLRNAYPGISLDNMVGHSDIAPGRKTDPGPFFDWEHLRTRCS